MYAVAGVTGNTGSVVASTLLNKGQAVRVIVRSAEKGRAWQKRGAEVAVADLGDAVAMQRALTGVKGAYVLLPPDTQAADVLATHQRTAEATAEALRAASLARVVVLSSVGAELERRTGPIATLRYVEQRLGKLPGVQFLRPGYFMENWASMLPAVMGDGVLPSFLELDQTIEMVATADIGEVAAEMLLAETPERLVELAGPAKYSPRDVAATLSELLGREIQAVFAPAQAIVPNLVEAGLGRNMAELYEEMLGSINRGDIQATEAPRRGRRGLRDALQPLLASAT